MGNFNPWHHLAFHNWHLLNSKLSKKSATYKIAKIKSDANISPSTIVMMAISEVELTISYFFLRALILFNVIQSSMHSCNHRLFAVILCQWTFDLDIDIDTFLHNLNTATEAYINYLLHRENGNTVPVGT